MSIQENIGLVKRHFQNEVLGDTAPVLAEMTDDCHYFMYPIIDELIDDKQTISAIHNSLSSAFTGMYIDINDIIATWDTAAANAILGSKQTGKWNGIPPMSGKGHPLTYRRRLQNFAMAR